MADPLLFACLNARIAVHYQPGDAGYDAAKVVKNRRSDIVPSPAAVVRVRSVEEVQAAVT